MAGNTRGKIKEHLEGIHRNCEWQKKHCSDILVLVGDANPTVAQTVSSLAEIIRQLDEFTLSTYSMI